MLSLEVASSLCICGITQNGGTTRAPVKQSGMVVETPFFILAILSNYGGRRKQKNIAERNKHKNLC